MGLSLVFVASLALSGASESERPAQACSNALIAELHITRGEWVAAEKALRYALIFDFDDGYLRQRLKHVLAQQGQTIAKFLTSKKSVRLRLPSRLKALVDQKAIAPSVAEK